jgi:hypothetical protein
LKPSPTGETRELFRPDLERLKREDQHPRGTEDQLLRLGVRFIEWGFGLGIFGMVLSFGIIGHYLHGARHPTGEEFLKNIGLWFACPWTLSVYAIQLGSLGMVAYGSVELLVGEVKQRLLGRRPQVSRNRKCLRMPR